MNAHIINIPDENYFTNYCIPNGFLGVGIVVPEAHSAQGLSSACRITYSMYADMKTVRVGDMIFVHAGNKIYGAFRAESEFCEDYTAPPEFLSRNIHYQPNPNVRESGWMGNNLQQFGDDYRRISITHFTDDQARNISYSRGIDSTEVFDLKFQGKIFSVPERWRYTDAARTVRPLLYFEALELLKLLEIENADSDSRFTIQPMDLSRYLPIEFILDNNIVENEKIIEGWIISQLGRNQSVDSIFKDFTSFGNNIPIGYLNFVDILGYKELISGIKKYKIVEVKKDDCKFPDHINQLVDYINKAAMNLVNGNFKLVEGFLIAKRFSEESIHFVEHFNQTGRSIKLISFQYDAPNFNNLILNRIV